MTKALILLTALPPTVGHGHLIKWAANFLKVSGLSKPQLYVMVCTQPGEPMCTERFEAVQAFCIKTATAIVPIRVEFLHATMPQYPAGPDDTAFWDAWGKVIARQIGPVDFVFSSEDYGNRLAEQLLAEHIPVDRYRKTQAVSATMIRNNPFGRFTDILPEFRRHVAKTVTIFGAESVGKTILANAMTGHHVTEWARPYLESLPSPEVTDRRMRNVVFGQFASQLTVETDIQHPIIVQDTDLFSTVGYYRIYNPSVPFDSDYQACVNFALLGKSDLYIMLPSDIPFHPDPLRYGGDKRESSDQFWTNLLDEFNCAYHVMNNANAHTRVALANSMARHLFLDQPIWSFKRDKAHEPQTA